MTWDPDIYLKFGGERTRPAVELLARVPIAAPARVRARLREAYPRRADGATLFPFRRLFAVARRKLKIAQ
jgi:trans-aconitate methyltransferase